ncbi:hypothetical protein [Mesorhizobium sp.]|uniref:hypothetical protein n=1 Tax=Mesorhizobium sp. TaxID=1871066 RepID=UPI0025CD24B1|nr:hypothetical protein [Mesorhizobium sp.]
MDDSNVFENRWRIRAGGRTRAISLDDSRNFPQSAESTMKQQRPFVVEIKQKRGVVKRPQSIWGGIDLAAIANDKAEAKTEGPVAEAAISPGEDVRSQPIAATGEAVSDAVDMIMPDVSLPEPTTVEEAPGSEASTGDRRARKKKRWQKDVPLPRAERWKRHLPWVFRQSRAQR